MANTSQDRSNIDLDPLDIRSKYDELPTDGSPPRRRRSKPLQTPVVEPEKKKSNHLLLAPIRLPREALASRWRLLSRTSMLVVIIP